MILRKILGDIFLGVKKTEGGQFKQEEQKCFYRDRSVPSVIVATHSYFGNGAAEMLLFLLQHLKNIRGWQIRAFSAGLSTTDLFALKDIGVEVVDRIDCDQYDFAITNTVVSGLSYVDNLSSQLPVLLWVHEGEFVLWNSTFSLGFWKRTFAAASHVVFQSKWQAERIFGSFTSSLSPEKYSVVRNCLPIIPDQIVSERKKGVRKKIVFVGGVYDRKRPGDVVLAAARLKDIDFECVLIGSDQHVDLMQEEAKRFLFGDKRFVLAGELKRVEALAHIASADVLCLPSMDESQPLVLMEAAHLGVPVIISDLAVYKETWVSGGNCLIHAVGDIEMLSRHITSALTGGAPVVRDISEVDIGAERFFEEFDRILDRLTRLRSG